MNRNYCRGISPPPPPHHDHLGKGGYVFGSVGLSVCGQHYSNSYERIKVKFYGGFLGSTMKS